MIRVITFDGKKTSWTSWKEKFLARAKRKGYKKVLLGDIEVVPDTTEIEDSDSDKAKKEKAREQNELAYADLTLSIDCSKAQGRVVFNLVRASKSEDYPDGHAATAWKNLERKFQPKTTPSITKLHKSFYGAKLKKGVDPINFITYMEDLRDQLAEAKEKMTDRHFITQMLNALTRGYDNEIRMIELEIDREEEITIENLKERLSLVYERMQDRGSTEDDAEAEDDEGDEKAFVSTSGGFKGLCRNCGKRGHKAADCPDKTKSKRINGKCNWCGIWGHKEQDCRKKKAGIERATVATETKPGEDPEVAFTATSLDDMEFCGLIDTQEIKEERIEIPDSFFDNFEYEYEDLDSNNCDVCCVSTMEEELALSDMLQTNQDLEYKDAVQEAHSQHGIKDKVTINTWIADSGASCHMVNDDSDMFNCHSTNENIMIGSGKKLKVTKIGSVRRVVRQKDGKELTIILEVKHVPGLWINLFSLTKALKNGAQLGNQGMNIMIKKNNSKILFDKLFETKGGYVCGVEICPEQAPTTSDNNRNNQPNQMAHLILEKGQNVSTTKLHSVLGHVGDSIMRKTANFYGWSLRGKKIKCDSCGMGKMKQKSVQKDPVERSTTRGERLFLDISSVNCKSLGGAKFWLLVIDDATDFCWSFFLKKKSQTSARVRELIKDVAEKYNINIQKIRCDNAGENKQLQKDCLRDGLGITFEYTAPRTPQQNGRVERKFATLYGRTRAMLIYAGLNEPQRKLLWCEGVSTATDLENMLVSDTKTVAAHNSFYGSEHKHVRSMHSFGTMATVRTTQQGNKMSERGRLAMFLGHAQDHPTGTYRFLSLDTRRVVLSRDIIWLGTLYGQYKKGTASQLQQLNDDDNDEPDLSNNPYQVLQQNEDDDDDNNDHITATHTDEEATTAPPTTAPAVPPRYNTRSRGPVPTPARPSPNPKTNRELRRLQWYDDHQHSTPSPITQSGDTDAERVIDTTAVRDTSQDVQEPQTGREDQASAVFESLFDEFVFSATEEHYDEPTTFREAWDHPDPIQREKWRAAIRLEFTNMNRRQVWRTIKRSDMPRGRRCVKHKWVFKIKRDGRFRARLVACGYSQIPGVDYTENYSPVIHDCTYRLLIVLQLLFKLQSRIIDVETAFLHGDLTEEIYMDCPQGMDGGRPDLCLKLEKTIYGLVQSARMFFQKLVKKLKDIGFTQSQADPCLMIRRSEKGIVIVATYVDDCYCVGNREALDEVTELLQKKTDNVEPFTVTVTDGTSDYLSCEVVFSNDGSRAWLGQPHLIKNLKKKFWEEVKNLQIYQTPGTPNTGLRRPTEDQPLVRKEEHTRYRSGVGMLLYLIKHSRPDIANSVRELTKLMDKPTPAAYKEMKRCIKFILDTSELGLKICPTPLEEGKNWNIVTYTDSDWAGDKDTRLSISGFIIFVMGVPIAWRSKQMKGVTLSSSEAECVSLSEAAKEIKFIYQIMTSMGLQVKTPITVRVDNVGAIFMSGNMSTSPRTRHVDIRYAYVREYVQDGFIKIIFVKTKENYSDGFTKNVSAEIYKSHTPNYVMRKSAIESADPNQEGCQGCDSDMPQTGQTRQAGLREPRTRLKRQGSKWDFRNKNGNVIHG